MQACKCEHCGHAFRARPRGRHRILCGNSANAADVARLMAGELASLVFTSPPYAQQRDYGEAAKEQVQDWLAMMCGVFAHLPVVKNGQVLVNLGLVHRDGEWIPYWDPWIEWMRTEGWRRFGWYVWDQGSGLPGDWSGRLGPSHEFVFHFNKEARKPNHWVEKLEASVRVKSAADQGLRGRDGTIKPVTNPEAFGQTHKIPASVVRVTRQQGPVLHGSESHPAAFSVAFAGFFRRTWLSAGEIHYDPYLGSATSVIAGHLGGVRVLGIEMEPKFVDLALARAEAQGLTVERETDA